MRRGDLVSAVFPGAYGKPRPALVVQANALLNEGGSCVLCPLTSDIRGYVYRVSIEALSETGLKLPSEVMVDKIGAVEASKVGAVIGRVSSATLAEVDRALAFFLGLRG